MEIRVKNSTEFSDNISPETLKSEYLTPENAGFFASDSGFLGARIKGTEYKRVILTRTLPLTDPEEFICVSDIEKN